MTIASHEKTARPALTPSLMAVVLEGGSRAPSLLGRQFRRAWNGGMSIGFCRRQIAGSAPADGGVGIIASIDRRNHRADFLERTSSLEAA